MEEFTDKCACKGSFLDRLTQPALLVILVKNSCHGFKMMEKLKESGMITGDSIDPAGLYRTLKRMENAGLVVSYWDTETGSKPKRIYSITEEGMHCLKQWRCTLNEYRNNIDTILFHIDSQDK